MVSRLQADSTGHAKRFRDFRALEALYQRLPERFDAETVGEAASSLEGSGQPTLSGSRRHLVLRHLTEHPAFDCELVSRQPLTGRKLATGSEDSADLDAMESNTTDQEVAPMD